MAFPAPHCWFSSPYVPTNFITGCSHTSLHYLLVVLLHLGSPILIQHMLEWNIVKILIKITTGRLQFTFSPFCVKQQAKLLAQSLPHFSEGVRGKMLCSYLLSVNGRTLHQRCNFTCNSEDLSLKAVNILSDLEIIFVLTFWSGFNLCNSLLWLH